MLISVIIPTRERVKYLYHSVRTALAIPDADVEIIVSDNVSTDGTAEMLAEIDDPRLRHIKPERRVSMRQNFQFALDQSRGDYVIFFGDDDGILPGQVPIMRKILEKHTPDGLSWPLPTYGWPSDVVGKKSGGVRFRPTTHFGPLEPMDMERCKSAVETRSWKDFSYFPRAYHGVVSRDYLSRISNDDGVAFCGSVPDIYISFRASQEGGDFIYAHHPFSLNGYSPASTGGGHSAFKADDKRGETARMFDKENQEDPLRDVFPSKFSIAAALFATLETIVERFPEPTLNIDRKVWYGYVKRELQTKSPELRDMMMTFLRENAERTGTVDEFDKAIVSEMKKDKTLGDRWAQLKGNIESFRLSAKTGGENTVLTAALMMDTVLGDNYAKVIDGEMTRSAAWRQAKANSRAFRRTL